MKNLLKVKFKFKLILFIVIFLGIFLNISLSWWERSIKIINDTQQDDEFKFIINEGENISDIIKRLEHEGFIKSYLAFRIYSLLNKIPLNFKFGEHTLKKNNDIENIIKVLNTDTIEKGITVTIIEGLRDDQIIDVLINRFPQLSRQTFEDIIKNPKTISIYFNKSLLSFIHEKYGISGMLFPDTYEFNNNVDEKDIITKMFSNFISKTRKYHENPDFYSKLILASIVERESSKEDDPNLIASVFKNRIKINMPLQSDATVNFITKKNDPGVLISDLLIDSPYNTYKNTGLPPSPICNPGLRSIEASFSEVQSEWFYFFHHNNKTYFSKNYDEHIQKLTLLGLI